MPTGPLDGVRVVDLTRAMAGPYATLMLADAGAEVIKVERPGTGDDTRGWGPPFVTGPDGAPGDSAYFHSCNRGKRSIALDLKSAEGQETMRRLAARSDVLIENYKVGGLKAYRLDYESLRAVNPRLVYCSITGFGQTGPYAGRMGYDFIIQGMSGIMDLTGEPDGEPQKMGVAFVDIFTGLYAVAAIQAALAVARDTGEGQHIDMSLLDSMVAVLANQAMNYLVSGRVPKRMGNAHPNITPYETFPVADGYIIIAVGNDSQFARLCQRLDLGGLPADPRFAANRDRVAHRAELRPLIAARTTLYPRDKLLALLEADSIPAGPINDLAQVFADPQIVARGLRIDLPCPAAQAGTVPSVASPIQMSKTPLAYGRPAPRLGEHTQEILREIGE
jgi:crotonobetainyl-CoA:carnitine CoA-transferase CaiB-like acyl-CoA transferase